MVQSSLDCLAECWQLSWCVECLTASRRRHCTELLRQRFCRLSVQAHALFSAWQIVGHLERYSLLMATFAIVLVDNRAYFVTEKYDLLWMR